MTTTEAGFVHPALFYAGPSDYLAGTVPFVRAGLEAGEPVLVAVPGPNLARIADALGDASADVRMADMTVAGRNPGRIIGSVLTAFADEHAGRRVRVIGEPIWAERSSTEYPACVQHEALINLAFEGRDATILCPYDTRRLSPAALLDATRTHPLLYEGAAEKASPGYEDPLDLVERYNEPLPEPDGTVDMDLMVFDGAVGARAVRQFVHDRAVAAGLGPDRVTDIRRAAHEVALNTIVHTGRAGLLSVWEEEGHLVCEVQDSGTITDPLAGRRPPEAHDGSGSGLLLVHALCDLVRHHRTDEGTTTRLFVRL